MHCRIICMNDHMAFTVVGHEELAVEKRAKEMMGELKQKYWEQNKHSYDNEESYNRIAYWHLHDTHVEVV
jgi:hypothetical protein